MAMEQTDLDKYVLFPSLSKKENNNFKVSAPIGLESCRKITEENEIKYVEVRLMIVDDDINFNVSIEKDKYSPYNILKISYKWVEYDLEEHVEEYSTTEH